MLARWRISNHLCQKFDDYNYGETKKSTVASDAIITESKKKAWLFDNLSSLRAAEARAQGPSIVLSQLCRCQDDLKKEIGISLLGYSFIFKTLLFWNQFWTTLFAGSWVLWGGREKERRSNWTKSSLLQLPAKSTSQLLARNTQSTPALAQLKNVRAPLSSWDWIS